RREPPVGSRSSAGLERGLGLLGHGLEPGRIAHRQVGEHLAVELDLGLLAAGDELAVREPLLPGRRVDADDPERAHRALANLAITVGVDERAVDLLLGAAVAGVLEAPVALGLLEDLAALLARVDRSLDAWHRSQPLPRSFSTFFSSLGATCTLSRPRFLFPGLLFTRWPGGVVRWRRRRKIFPAAVTLNRFFAPLFVFCFGIVLHSCVLRRAEHHD